MAKTITGSVWRINEVKRRGTTLYSIQLDNEKYYGTGDYEPECKVGDKVRFKYEVTDRGYNNAVDPEKMQIKRGAGTKPPKDFGKKGGNRGKGGYQKKDDPATQAAIIMQSASKVAADVLFAGLSNDAIPLPKTNKDKLDAILDAYNKIADDIFDRNLGIYVKVKGGTKLEDLLAAEEEEGDEEDFDDDWEDEEADDEESADEDDWEEDEEYDEDNFE